MPCPLVASPPRASCPYALQARQRDYTRYLLSRVLAACGSAFQSVGVSWQVYQLTSQAFALGLIDFAQFAPFLLLFLVAGAAADRWPRARILGACGGVQTLCALLLSVLTWTHTASFPRLLTLLVLLDVSVRTIYNLVKKGAIPATRVGREWRFVLTGCEFYKCSQLLVG